MLKNKYNKGFTLIEIVAILILIGILMAVAASKYFDMRDEAQKRAALATVAEAQSRINSVFAQRVLSGDTCTVARNTAKELDNIDDDQSRDYDFGDYYLTNKGENTTNGTISVGVGLISETPEREITTATLYLPECGSKNGGSVITKEWWTHDKILQEYGYYQAPDGINSLDDLAKFLKTLVGVGDNTGVLYYLQKPITGLFGEVLVPAGYYVHGEIRLFEKNDHKLNESVEEDDWATYSDSEGKWTTAPKYGGYCWGENGELYMYIGENGASASKPSDSSDDWIKFQKKPTT